MCVKVWPTCSCVEGNVKITIEKVCMGRSLTV